MSRRRHRHRAAAARPRVLGQALVLSLLVAGTAGFTVAGEGGAAPWAGPAAADDVVASGQTAALEVRDRLTGAASRADASLVRSAVPRQVTVRVVVDGQAGEVTTGARTVREALLDAGVMLGPHDRLSVPLDAAVQDGTEVTVTPVVTEVRSETVTTAFGTVREDDAGLDQGEERVAREGVDGVRVLTFEAHLVAGEEVDRTVLAERVVTEPVDELVRVGTRVAPPPPSVPASSPVSPGTARAIARDMVHARGWGDDQFACLDALWQKESNWRVTAQNPSSGAYGIPQSLPGSKMASAGADWRTNAATQITWGLGYIAGRYGTPCGAWAHSQARNWY